MIMGEIRRFCRDDGMLKVSRTLKTLAAQAGQMREKMTKNLGRDITLQELANGLGIALEELLPALEATKDVESLSASLFEGENGKMCIRDRKKALPRKNLSHLSLPRECSAAFFLDCQVFSAMLEYGINREQMQILLLLRDI